MKQNKVHKRLRNRQFKNNSRRISADRTTKRKINKKERVEQHYKPIRSIVYRTLHPTTTESTFFPRMY